MLTGKNIISLFSVATEWYNFIIVFSLRNVKRKK